MHRSRPFAPRRVRLALALVAVFLVAVVAAPSAVSAGTGVPFWVSRVSYMVDTVGVSDHLLGLARLDASQQRALVTAVAKLDAAYDGLARESDPVVGSTDLTPSQKRAAVTAMRYNERLASAEASCYAELAASLGPDALARLGDAADATWQWDREQRDYQNAVETVQAMSVGAQAAYVPAPYTVFATQFGINRGTPVNQVAVPDKYAKFANWGNSQPGYPSGAYAVLIRNPANGRTTIARVWDCGPWNTDDNYWNSRYDPVRPRRLFKDLPMGKPESVAAFRDGYNGGLDQSGRRVTQEAALDLGVDAAEDDHWDMRSPWVNSVPYALGIGIRQNVYLQITPMWEASLKLDAPVAVSAGPYFRGQRVTAVYRVKNVGTQPGTWDQFTFTLKNGTWSQNPTYQGPSTIGAGMTRTYTFTQIIGVSGMLTGIPQARRAGSWAAITTQNVTFNVAPRTVDRVPGADRYDTAVQMSRKAYPGTAAAVVIATGRTFPDGLAGAALAHVEGGPLLLVGTGVPTGVVTELKRLKPGRVFILGSTGAVSSAEETQVLTALPSAIVTRLAGVDRYETAAKVAAAVAAHNAGLVKDGTAIVATGKTFPDAMSAAALSAEKGWPILLTAPATLPTATKTAITALGVKNTLLVGGEGVVSRSVAATLPACTRLAGVDRYETAAKVADYAAKKGLSYAYVGLTTGVAFPDALAGGVLAAHAPGMMLITPPTSLPEVMRVRLVAHRTVTAHLQAYGSTGAVSDAALHAAEDALR